MHSPARLGHRRRHLPEKKSLLKNITILDVNFTLKYDIVSQ